LPSRFGEARDLVERVFPPKGRSAGGEAVAVAAKQARQLVGALERLLGPRGEWGVPVLRELWGALWAGVGRRRRSAEHERVFFQLCGYALRPGLGYPLDDWRCEQMAGLFGEGLHFAKERAVWTEYWVAWRRIAGGLTAERHREIWEYLRPHLGRALDPGHAKHLGRPKGVVPEGLPEMVRLAAVLEHLEAGVKEEIGGWVVAQLEGDGSGAGPWAWALGRLGARVPLFGSVHQAVSADVAEGWMRALGAGAARRLDGAAFAMAQMARRTGDRALDVGDEARSLALEVIRETGGAESWARMVREVTGMERADEARAMGDTLPSGLSL